MRKADAYKKGMQDALDPFGEQIRRVADDVHNVGEVLDDIIDCIEWNVEDPEELINKLKDAKAKRAKPRQFRISIIYNGKENESFADTLRKDLNNLKNSCEMIDYLNFTKHVGGLVDYRVYIGNLEKVRAENCKVLYKAYGMEILETGSSYVVAYDPKHKFEEADKEKFIAYYEFVINKALERSKEAEKVLKARKKRKASHYDPLDPQGTYSVWDGAESVVNNIMYFWDGMPLWLQIPLGIPSILLSFLAFVVTTICLIPVGISEIALRATVDNLREAHFDKKFIAEAQRHILEVKLVDLFRQEQMRGIYDNNTETSNT